MTFACTVDLEAMRYKCDALPLRHRGLGGRMANILQCLMALAKRLSKRELASKLRIRNVNFLDMFSRKCW